jgi:hypothetical protein
MGEWRYVSIILNLSIVFIPPTKQPPVPTRKDEGGRVCLDVVKKRKIVLPLPRIKLCSVVQFVSLVPISTEISLTPTGK